jgi:hypothetical protein
MRWARHAAWMGEMRNAKNIFGWKTMKGRDHSEDLNVDWRTL